MVIASAKISFFGQKYKLYNIHEIYHQFRFNYMICMCINNKIVLDPAIEGDGDYVIHN